MTKQRIGRDVSKTKIQKGIDDTLLIMSMFIIGGFVNYGAIMFFLNLPGRPSSSVLYPVCIFAAWMNFILCELMCTQLRKKGGQ